MKKYLAILCLTVLLAPTFVCLAESVDGPPDVDVSIIDIIKNIVNWVFTIFLAISALFIILAAFQFLTAGGDSSKVSAARDKLLYAAIGIGVAVLSRAIVPIVRNILNL